MESNEQLTNKENRGRLIDGEEDDSYWEGGYWGVKGLSKKEKGLMDNSVLISMGSGYKGTKW